MGTYDNHPGGGYQEQKGYVPPAGSMADEQRRQREADAQRGQQESHQRQQEALQAQMRDRASVDREIEQRRAQPGGSKQSKTSAQSNGTNAAKSRPAWGSKPARPASPQVPQRAWNPLFGTIGFLVVTVLVGNKMTGESRWILAVALGLFAGAVIGRLWKPILVLGAIGGALWLWGKTPRRDAPHAPTTPTNAPSGSWFEPSPRPVEVGVEMPPYVPRAIPGDPPAPTSSSDLSAHPGKPPKFADYQVTPPLFVPGDALVKASWFNNAPVLVVHHTRPITYDSITQIEFVPATGYTWAHLTNGTAVGLGIEVADTQREFWMKADYVGFVLETPKVSGELRSIPLTRQ